MKKLIFTIITCAIASLTFGQIDRHTWLTGASSTLGYNRYSTNANSTLTVVNANLKGGYSVVTNLMVGINLSYFGSSVSAMSSNPGSSSSDFAVTSIGLFARYYFPKNIFIGAGLSAASSSTTTKFASGSTTSNGSHSTTLPLELGVALFVSKNFAIEPSLNYIKAEDSIGLIYNSSTLISGVSQSIGINLGLAFYLNRNSSQSVK